MNRPHGIVAVIVATLGLAALAEALPWLGVSPYARTLVYYVAYYLALGQAWNLMSGLTGYVSFAHGALAGIGAYAVVIALNGDWPMAGALAAAMVASVLASLVIGATSLRLRGTAFTFATLFFQELVLLLLRKLPFTGGPGGLVLDQILPLWVPYVMMIAVAAGSTIVLALTRRSRLGIRVLAIKNDEVAAAAIGIHATRLKLILFCASAGIAGLVGAIHGLYAASLYPDTVFSVDISLIALAVPLIGGVATVSGPLVGAVLYVGIREVLQVIAPGAHLVIVGLLLLAVILYMRDGVVVEIARRRRRRRDAVLAGGPVVREGKA
ncbi:MAG TPA: branched-chain amino acid ABC transporter permease [Casimicrobiaceae bacterium]|nr:branched-chain amino acid ABC transporter permease [Casimicrobiaceae bacterium]